MSLLHSGTYSGGEVRDTPFLPRALFEPYWAKAEIEPAGTNSCNLGVYFTMGVKRRGNNLSHYFEGEH